MQIFKISPEELTIIRKKILYRTILLITIAISIAVVSSILNSKNEEIDIDFVKYGSPFLLAMICYIIYRSVNKQMTLLKSYQLTIGDNIIRREQFNTPVIDIHYFEIKDIIKQKNSIITIRGEKDVILVPKQISDYDQLEATLNTIQTISTIDSATFLEKYQKFAGLFAALFMACLYISNNKIVVGITGVLAISLMIWNFIQVQQNKNIDNTTRKAKWSIFCMLAFIIITMIAKLTGIRIEDLFIR